MNEKPIVIIGGGLSGLMMANLLARDGHRVRIIEKRTQTEIDNKNDVRSINLTLSDRGISALEALGLRDKVEAVSTQIESRIVHKPNGQHSRQSYISQFNPALYSIQRRDLQRVLLSAAQAEPNIEITLGCQLTSLNKQTAQVTLTSLATQVCENLDAKLIIGADGAFSQVRQQMHRGEPASYEQTFFDWSYKQFNIPSQSPGKYFFEKNGVHIFPSKEFLIIALPNNDGTFNCNLFFQRGRLTQRDQYEQMIEKHFPELLPFSSQIVSQLEAHPESYILSSAMKPWYYGNTTVVIGDAAHTTYHFYAQGLNSALHDCLVLAREIKLHGINSTALQRYESHQKPEADAIRNLSAGHFEILLNAVVTTHYEARLKVESWLHTILGSHWVPSYSLVTGRHFSYVKAAQAMQRRSRLRLISGQFLVESIVAGVLKSADLLPLKHSKVPGRVNGTLPQSNTTANHPYAKPIPTTHIGFSILFFFIFFWSGRISGTEINVGIASTLADVGSNSSIPHGDFFRRGLFLAAEDYKAELKKRDLTLQFQEFDYGNSRLKVLEMAKKAIASDVVAVIGYNFSDHALLAAPLHQEAKLPLITPTATADRIAQFGSYIHQVTFTNSFQVGALAKLAANQLKATRIVSVVAQDCTYCQDLSNDFTLAFKKRVPKGSVITIPILKGEEDFGSVIKAFKAITTKTDLIFVPNHELTSAKTILAFLNAGYQIPFLGGDGWANYGTRIFQSIFMGKPFTAFAVSQWSPKDPIPVSLRFVKKYSSAYGVEPNLTSAMAYDSMVYLIKGILACRSYQRTDIETCLASIKNMRGVAGNYRFHFKQSTEKDISLLEYKDGHFDYLRTISP